MKTCPNCKSIEKADSHYCGNCGTGLLFLTRGISTHVFSGYRKVLIFIGIYTLSNPFFWYLINLIRKNVSPTFSKLIHGLSLMDSILFSAIPFFIALSLPKNSNVRTVFFVISLVFLIIRACFLIWREVFYYKMF